MSPVATVEQVFAAIQKVKADASAFCTNFFPVQRKLQGWIDQGELQGDFRQGTAFFFRKDRDFWRFYFCAPDAATLQQELSTLSILKTEPMVTDVVGSEAALVELPGLLEAVGFRRYSRLQRMARSSQAGLPPVTADGLEVVYADAADRKGILDLLNCSFDPRADQLPTLQEIDTAIESRQMLAIKSHGAMAALLFFETQGFTSMIRYWVVAEKFRSRRCGGALMRYYLETQSAVRRFILWVVADNANAVQKYQHYGYAADGLVDQVLVNNMIRP